MREYFQQELKGASSARLCNYNHRRDSSSMSSCQTERFIVSYLKRVDWDKGYYNQVAIQSSAYHKTRL